MSKIERLWDNKLTWIGLFVLLLALGLGWTLLSRVPAAEMGDTYDRSPLPQKGFPAPDFTLETVDGRQVTLSDLRGQVLVVNFWASWCPPCRAEMPAIEQVHREYSDAGLVVLAVNLRENSGQITAFTNPRGLSFPVLMDLDGRVFDQYQVKALPSTFFVDREGVIRNVAVGGPLARAFIESQAASMLEQEGE